MHGPVAARMHRTSAAESRRPLLPPDAVRMRKVELDPQIRGRDAKRRSTGAAPARVVTPILE